MTASCPFEDLVAAHALGALDGEERASLGRHLAAGCPVCDAELQAMGRVAEGIALSPPPVAPRPEVRQRLLARAAEVRPPGAEVVPIGRQMPPVASQRRDWMLAAAVLIALLGVVFWWGSSAQLRAVRGERQRAELADDLAAARARLSQAETEKAALLRHLAVLGASRLQQVELAALPPAPSASGRVFVDPGSGRALFTAAGLEALAPNRTYQLWAIADGQPVSAGTFDAAAGGRGQLLVERAPPADRIDAWAVTVEPAGGVPQPTGAMVLKG